jgi:hypothetical protein
MPLSCLWNLENFGTLVFEWEILFPTAKIWPPVQKFSTRDNLSFWFQVGYQVAPNICIGRHVGVMNPCSLELSARSSQFENLALPKSNFCSNWVFRRTCSTCENKLMNVYLMEAQLFQMVEPTCSSPDGLGASSSGSDIPLPPRTMVEAFMATQKGMLCQILHLQQQLV